MDLNTRLIAKPCFFRKISSSSFFLLSLSPKLSDLEKMINAYIRKLPRSRMGPSNLIERKHTKEKVYEYRSGILVPMVFDEYRGLIPEVGGKIIDFKDYRYTPEARRIYNLPGRFVPVVK